MHSLPRHSPLAISAGEIWGPSGNCTGYVQMVPFYPDDDSEASREGTAAHELFVPMIEAASRGGVVSASDYVGKSASNGVIWTEEMWEGAGMFAAEVLEAMRATGVFGGPHFGTEQRVAAPQVHELFYGTCDQFLFDAKNGVLYVWDYKFGFGRVNAYRNMQLMGYAICILHTLGLFDGTDDHITVKLSIVQPRAYHSSGPVQSWSCRASELRNVANQYALNAAEALSDNAVCRSGPHCANCVARIGCDAFQEYAARLFRASATPVPHQLTPQQLGLQIHVVGEAADMLKKLYEGYEAAAEAMTRSGQDVPGVIAETRWGRKAWNQPDEQVINVGKMLEVDLAAPQKAITPAQAKKLGMHPEVLKGLTTTPNRGLKITRDNNSLAKKVFQK